MLHQTESVFESPTLTPTGATRIPAFELKFLLTDAQAREVEHRARTTLVYDPYADPRLGNAYHTTSLYCDTAQYDVFRRRPPHKRRKHRLRRYDHAAWVFLERKCKWGDRVEKRRTRISDEELSNLALASDGDAHDSWPGHWFRRCLWRRQLQPVCRIAYDRIALVGHNDDGPLRLTFDRNIRGTMTGGWCVDPFAGGLPVMADRVICEFKFRSFLPRNFREMI